MPIAWLMPHARDPDVASQASRRFFELDRQIFLKKVLHGEGIAGGEERRRNVAQVRLNP
jgi:hypothetical protein